MTGFIGPASPWWNTQSSKIRFTSEGGLAIRLINDTGAVSVKGTIVKGSQNINNAVSLIPIDNPDPLGVVYEAGIPNGELVWIVIQGIAHVLYTTIVTRGTFSRCPAGGDIAPVAGRAINEALPVPPFATNKHFQEIGHPIESIGVPGLALTILHFN